MFFAVGNDGADLWSKPVNGAAGRRLLAPAANPNLRLNPVLTTIRATSDHRFLVFTAESRGSTRSDLWMLPLQPDGKPAPLLQQAFDQRDGSISPDGRWLTYVSNESGINEVFVRPLMADSATGLPVVGMATPVSQGGGNSPRWRADAHELFYQSARGRVMAVAVSPNRIDKPVELFEATDMPPHWDVSSDGQRFLVLIPVAQAAQVPITVTVNWQAAK